MVGERDFLDFAAGVFGVAPGGLSLETTLGSIPEWDSMAHLRLVMSVQSKYGVEIPFADVTNVTSLWEFFRRVNGLSPKKVVAVDLDGTLWDGVAGEDGADAVRPNAAFQAKLKELKDRGVLLVALSKNNFEDVRGLVEAFGDFVAWRIDWNAKAENLADVAAELNLGVDSFVFVDDNPAERIEMKARLPAVAVASFPPNMDAYFPPGVVTEEDRAKTEEYRAEAKRREWAASVGDLGKVDVWKELGAWVDTYIFSASNTPAATAAAMTALHIIQNEPQRIQALWDVTNYALKRFREEGFEIGDTESPIIPLYVRDVEKTFLVTALAFKAGVFINPVIPPACAPQDTLVRYALMATHTKEQVDRSVVALKKIFVEQGIIK